MRSPAISPRPPAARDRGAARAPRAAVLGALSLSLAGCGAETLDVWLGLPAAEGAATLLIGAPERSSARVYVADVRDGPGDLHLDLGERSESDAPLELAYFDTSVAAANLSPGWQSAPGAGAARVPLAAGNGAALGAPSATYRSALFDEPATWLPTERLSAEVGGFEVTPAPPTCQALHAPRISGIEPFTAIWAIALSDELSLITDEFDGHHILSSVTGRVTDPTVPERYTAGDFRDGWVYVGDAAGRVFRGRGDPDTIIASGTQLGDALPRIVRGLAAGGADDVFALLSDGTVHHFGGTAWREIGQATDPRTRMYWLRPQEALMMADAPNIIYRLTSTSLRTETVAETGILTAALIPELGLLAGTSDGEVLRSEAGGWGRLGDKRYGWWVVDIEAHAGGAAFLLASGTVGGFREDVGFCEDLFSARIITRGWLIPQAAGLMMIGKPSDVVETQFNLLEPL